MDGGSGPSNVSGEIVFCGDCMAAGILCGLAGGQLVEVGGAEGVMAPAGRGSGGSAESLR